MVQPGPLPDPATLPPLATPDAGAGLNTFPLPEDVQTKLDELVKANLDKAKQPEPVLKPTGETVNKEGSPAWSQEPAVPAPIYIAKGEENMQAEVRRREDGKFAVVVRDNDSGKVASSEVLVFSTLDAAKAKADQIKPADASDKSDRSDRKPETASWDPNDYVRNWNQHKADVAQATTDEELESVYQRAISDPERSVETVDDIRWRISDRKKELKEQAEDRERESIWSRMTLQQKIAAKEWALKRVDAEVYRQTESQYSADQAVANAPEQQELKQLRQDLAEDKESTVAVGSLRLDDLQRFAKAGDEPKPAVSQYKRHQSLILSPFGRFKKPQTVKFRSQDDFGAQVYLPKSKQYLTVDPGLLSLPRAVATRKADNAELAKLSAADRKQAKADAREFDRLLREEGAAFGFYNANVELDTSAAGQKAKSIELKRARVSVLKALGADIPENSTTLERARHLPKLKALMADKTLKVEQSQRFDEATEAGAIEVLPAMLEVGDKLIVEGTELEVIEATDHHVTLENGQRFGTQQIGPDEIIYVEEIDKEENADFLDEEAEEAPTSTQLTAPKLPADAAAAIGRHYGSTTGFWNTLHAIYGPRQAEQVYEEKRGRNYAEDVEDKPEVLRNVEAKASTEGWEMGPVLADAQEQGGYNQLWMDRQEIEQVTANKLHSLKTMGAVDLDEDTAVKIAGSSMPNLFHAQVTVSGNREYLTDAPVSHSGASKLLEAYVRKFYASTSKAAKDSFKLEVIDDAQFDAEQEKIRQQQEARARQEEFERQKHARLTGDTGNLGQGDMFGQTTEQGIGTDDVDLFSPKPGKQSPPSVGRSKPKEEVHFAKPIQGPSGAKLMSYVWQYQMEEYIDSRGEDAVRRVSDWDKSIPSDETGREIVHQFMVLTPDGVNHQVSIESAINLLGFTNKTQKKQVGSLASTAKTLARLRLEERLLEEQSEAWQQAKREVDNLPPAEVVGPKPLIGKHGVTKGKIWTYQWEMGGGWVHQKESGPLRRYDDLVQSYRDAEMAARGFDSHNSGGYKLADVQKRIARAEKRLKEAASRMPQETKNSGSTKATGKATGAQWPGPAPQSIPQTQSIPVADDLQHSSLPLGLPELVQLSKGLGGGKYPKLKKRLRALKGQALGIFRHSPGDPKSGEIQLRQDLFQLITEEEKAKIMAAAVAQADAAVPGTVAGDSVTFTDEEIDERQRIIDEYYTGEIEALKAERLMQEPVLASKVLAHEIGHWVDFLPQAMIDGRGNLLGRIASLKRYLKQTLPKSAKMSGDRLLTMKDRARLRRAAERENGPRPKNEAARQSWSAAVKESYQAKVKAEIEERGLLTVDELRAELKPLIQWHRGADAFEEYFNDSDEMYAEAFSVFLVNPAAMAKRAPKYFQALISYLERKPEVAGLYEKIQNELRTGEFKDTRAKNLRESFDKDTEAWRRRVKLAEDSVADNWVDNIIYHFDRRFGPVYRKARSYKQEGRLKEAVGSFLYRGSEHELFLGTMNREVGQLLVDHNLDWKDFGAYLFHQRIIDSEHDVANPLGFSPNSSTEAIGRMTQTLGVEAMETLEQARQKFRGLYEDMVVPLLQSSGLVSPELQQLIEERVYYATFQAVKGKPETDIDALLDQQLGTGVGAAIYRRVGNIKDVANPATATVNKAMSLISAAHRNAAKREVVRMLMDQEPELIREADKRWTGKRYEYIERGHPGDAVQTMYVLENGEPKAYYVRNYIAEAFNTGNPIENKLFVKFLQASRTVKSLFTQWNPGFWAVNYLRDAVGVYQQVPGMTMTQYARLLPRAMKAARASLKHSKRNKDAEHALRERVLISQSDPRGIKGDVADEYEMRLASFGLDPAQWDKSGPKSHAVAKAWNWYREQGQSLERVHKIMGLIHLEEKFPDMPEWQKREIVRERAGSPDFLQRPASKAFLDAFALFYTPWKEGLRSFTKSAKQNPWQFSGKMAMTMALPTIMQVLAEMGAFGEERKRQMESVSDYDATNYLVFPIGWEDEKQSKAAYLRLPLWEPARVLHGLMTKAMTGRGEGLMSYAGGQVPGGNPLVGVAADWATFAIFNKNPYDYHYEGNVLDKDKMTAEDPTRWVDMLQHTWNSLGGGMFYRFKEPHLRQPDPTKLEKALQVPIVGPVVNRFLKVSNRGIIQKDEKKIFQPIEKQRARVRLAMKEILRKQIAAEPLTDAERKLMISDPYAQQYWLSTMPEAMASRNIFLLDRLNRAPTKEARLLLLQEILSNK